MYFATNFCTGLFLLERFIDNRKTSSGAILFTAILYSLLSIQINSFFFLDTQGTVADLGEGPGGGGPPYF